ncbi:WD40 repeat domain-containing protein [Marinilongibacter aquaticus]|uniref:WD40 repeat domain-containing protein n=1 Tax=Marinilongibacter aquaticus TaxID=2975157 RepID=UPI0021BD4370|nr:WD40 repeat domain-containing protein [Marinilongibacter aquaticus]UBM58309.1 WD40 repeat domain-containing protein [Marinilongibacter aquaticus]
MKFEVEKIEAFTGHRDAVYTVVGENGQTFFSGSGDGMVVEWDSQKPDIGKPLAQFKNSVYAIRLDAERKELWVAENYEGLRVFDLENRKEKANIALQKTAYFDIQLYEDLCFVAGGDGVISIIDREHMAFKKHLKLSDKSVRCIAINPVEREFAAGYSDNLIRTFDLQSLAYKKQIEGHTNSVFTLQYGPRFEQLYSAGRDARIKNWSLLEGYQLNQEVVAHMYAINHLAFSPNGDFFATCSMDKSIKLWQTENMRLLKVIDRARHAGHGTSVNKLLWLNENHLVSASDDRSLSLWKFSNKLV